MLKDQTIDPIFVLNNNVKEIYWVNKSDIESTGGKKDFKCGFVIYNKKEGNWNCYIKLVSGNINKRVLLYSPFDIDWKFEDENNEEISFEDMLKEINQYLQCMK